MNNGKNRNFNNAIIFLFLICGIVLAFQHSLVSIYFDDFGNASLSYGYDAGITGTAWTLTDLFAWARWCYNNWGGRILYALTILFPLIKESAMPFMLLQAVVITIILFLIYKIVCCIMEQEDSFWVATFIIMCYGLIGQDIHKNGTYWASASVLYVWPLLPFLLSVLYYLYIVKKIESNVEYKYIRYIFVQIILIFYATFSQEQTGLMVVVFYIMVAILHHPKQWKKYGKIDTVMIGTALFSYTILFFAPGNFSRMNTTEFSNLNFIEKIVYNYPRVINGFFFDGFKWFNILLSIGLIYLAVKLIKKEKIATILVATSILQLLVCLDKNGFISLGIANTWTMSFAIINIIVVSTIYFFVNNKKEVIALIYAGGASVLCLLYSPTIAERSYIAYIFFVIMLCGIVLYDMLLNANSMKLYKNAIYICVVIISIISLQNFIKIYRGYYINSFYNNYNHTKLSNYQGEEVVTLAKLPDLWYAGEMPYTEGFDFIEYWMREYYNIPSGVDFIWGDLEVNKSITKNGEFYPDGWFGKSGEIVLRDWGKETLELKIAGLYPTMESNKLMVSINEDKKIFDIPSGSSSILIDVPEEGEVIISIEADNVIVPKEIGAGEDTRNMSMLLSVK